MISRRCLAGGLGITYDALVDLTAAAADVVAQLEPQAAANGLVVDCVYRDSDDLIEPRGTR